MDLREKICLLDQRKIEEHLFETQNKILNRFSTLMNYELLVAGLFLTITISTLSKNTPQNFLLGFIPIENSSVYLGFLFLFISIMISCYNMLYIDHNKLVVKGNLLKYRSGDELEIHNIELYNIIQIQTANYTIVLMSFAFSLFSLSNYFLKNIWVLIICVLVFFVVLVLDLWLELKLRSFKRKSKQ